MGFREDTLSQLPINMSYHPVNPIHHLLFLSYIVLYLQNFAAVIFQLILNSYENDLFTGIKLQEKSRKEGREKVYCLCYWPIFPENHEIK